MAKTLSTMMMQLGSAAPEFSLPDLNGTLVSRQDFTGKPLLVLFWCVHCPFVQHVEACVVALAEAMMPRGLAVVAINPNDLAQVSADGPSAMRLQHERGRYPFSYLVDASQKVAKAFRAACTPDFFLFDAAHKLGYRGALGAGTPGNEEPVTDLWLREAIEAVFARRPPLPVQRASMGCSIKWLPGEAPAWAR